MLSYLMRLTVARYALGLVTVDDLRQVAAHLRDRGLHTPLATWGRTRMPTRRDGGQLFEATLRQLDIAPFPKPAAADILVRHYLWGIVEGVLEPTQGLRHFVEKVYLPLQGAAWDTSAILEPFKPIAGLYWGFRHFDGSQWKYAEAVTRVVADWMRRHCLAAIDPGWLTWNGGTIPRLAQVIDDDGAFERLPILADALEEAGCTHAEMLNHCRYPGEHVCNCWVLDVLHNEDKSHLFTGEP
jgi:hypothetical protein